MPSEPRARRSRSRASIVLYAILGVAVVGSTIAIAQRSEYRFFDPLIDVKAIISEYAVEDPDLEALQRGAITGMLEAMDDPYAVYVPPGRNQEFEKQLTGEYVGIGAEVNMVEGVFTIVTPMEDSPAFRAGIMAGDKVREIDGEPTEGLTIDECIDRLVGEEGTEVTLTVERDGEMKEITVTRAEIKARAVRGIQRSGDGNGGWDYWLDPERRIGYIRLSSFTPSVTEEFTKALATVGARREELNGLVIDVRWNPGGLLDRAVELADLFLDEGVIVSTNGRAFEETVWRADEAGTLPDFPVAVLINSQSASASEVLAGALVENGRAIAVGERTFGKGSVQSVRPLSGAGSGGLLKLTEQHYYLPSGRSLQRTDDSTVWGVDPTPGYFIPVDEEELVDMLRIRREAEILDGETEREAPHADPSWIIENLSDRQLAAAIRALAHHVDTGAWPEARGEDEVEQKIATHELNRVRKTRERMLRELDRIEERIDTLSEGVTPDEPEWDLWDDAAEIEGGEVVVRGPGGGVVARLRITGPDLERWLLDADLEPVE
jgi:carboxyl-terminal processing protease